MSKFVASKALINSYWVSSSSSVKLKGNTEVLRPSDGKGVNEESCLHDSEVIYLFILLCLCLYMQRVYILLTRLPLRVQINVANTFLCIVQINTIYCLIENSLHLFPAVV